MPRNAPSARSRASATLRQRRPRVMMIASSTHRIWTHEAHRSACSLYPRKRTKSKRSAMSALCQKRTFALQQDFLIRSPRRRGREPTVERRAQLQPARPHEGPCVVSASALLADASRLHESARGEKQKNEGERLNQVIKGVVVKVDGMQVDPDLLDRGGDECQHHSGESGEKKTGLFAPVGEGKRNQQEGCRRQIVNDRDREGLADKENDCDVADEQQSSKFGDSQGARPRHDEKRAYHPACQRSDADRDQRTRPNRLREGRIIVCEEAMLDSAQQRSESCGCEQRGEREA